jgi:hypothetical protein
MQQTEFLLPLSYPQYLLQACLAVMVAKLGYIVDRKMI